MGARGETRGRISIVSESKRLPAKGWKIGSAREFLDLNDQEHAYIELRLKLADALKRQRISRNLTQEDLARAMSSSQSRVARMEAGDASVSLDRKCTGNEGSCSCKW